jgi:hypothetical protein
VNYLGLAATVLIAAFVITGIVRMMRRRDQINILWQGV